jgi:hypothetical protein
LRFGSATHGHREGRIGDDFVENESLARERSEEMARQKDRRERPEELCGGCESPRRFVAEAREGEVNGVDSA